MQVLYKYVSADRALGCIPEVGNGTLRATQPVALNDPFEGALRPTYVPNNRAEENRQLAEVLTNINPNSPVTETIVQDARQTYGSLFIKQLFSNQASTRLGIVSFSEKHDHPLMWSHYTADGSGFVIGYDIETVVRQANLSESLHRVRYVDKLPFILGPAVLSSPPSNIAALLSVKSDNWSYEVEWRLIVELSRTIGTGERDQHGHPINLVRVPNEAVVSVHYTERTPNEEVELIRRRLATPNNRYTSKRPIKLVLSSETYGYEEASDA